jgi:predicted O-methyltransferase YrrM
MELNFTIDYIENNTKTLLTDIPILSHFEDCKKESGKEHYFFLASLSKQMPGKKIIELGTHNGRSTLALNYGNNTVYTYDIKNWLVPNIFTGRPNINFRLENLFDANLRELNKEHILSSDLIFIDIDPHEGVMELEMYNWLKQNDYKGLILFDDIHLGPGHMGVKTGNSMEKTLWSNIEDKYKLDLTHVGHWSGTGLVSFQMDKYKIIT